MDGEVRIGVFVCECGDKIAGLLGVPALAQQARELPGVKWAGQAGYGCSPNGLDCMRAVIAEQRLDRVVIAGCAPRTHEGHFRRALSHVNPALINVTNLRDLCARPHRDNPAGVMNQAHDQIAMAVADLAARQPATPRVAHITPRAVVIGGGIAGMTAALAISDGDIPVILVEREPELGGLARLQSDDREVAERVSGRIAAVCTRPNITVLTNTLVTGVNGSVGRYRIALSDGQVTEAGAVIIATGASANLQSPIPNPRPPASYAFVLCDMTPEKQTLCQHACCLSAFRQAAEIKRQSPATGITIFFRELYTAGGAYDELVWEAQRLGVSFVRYPAGRMPQAVDGEIVTCDELTGHDVHVPCDQVIYAAPMEPPADNLRLAEMLRLPADSAGFLADVRVRLRPSDHIERGVYVCGAAHYPCDAERATFEAYSVAARAVRHIQKRRIANWSAAATIDVTRCNGCGDCVRVCPFMAISLQPRHGDIGLAVIDLLLCTGCGNCVSVCPVKAAQVPSATDEQIEAQIRAALRIQSGHLVTESPCHLVFACEWSGYSAAEVAGAQGHTYPVSTRIIRLNCTGRLQPGLILKAFEMGAAGVLILGCAPGMCHYEQGNERCTATFEQASGLARLLALDDRLKLEWIPPDDGAKFARVMTDFVGRRMTRDE